jgi:predicted nucleic acid-binding protein
MTRIRAFADSSLLIAAARGIPELSDLAIEVLDDPHRDFVTSDFVRLEVLPKAIYHGQVEETRFYEEFFQAAEVTVRSSAALVAEAQAEAELAGLSAVDALHVAAAKRAHCDEMITAEGPGKPLFKVSGLRVATIRPVE